MQSLWSGLMISKVFLNMRDNKMLCKTLGEEFF